MIVENEEILPIKFSDEKFFTYLLKFFIFVSFC